MFVMNRYSVLLYFFVLHASTARSSKYCRYDEFRCKSGDCIDDSFLCDGTAECADSSDEIEELCSILVCPNVTFRCSYGACISKKSKCNGIPDCADGSDESPSLCGTNTTDSSPSESCLIPGNITNGNYALNDQPMDQSYSANVSLLFVNCDLGFSNNPPETFYSICRNGIWTPSPPTCSHSCSPLNKMKYPRIRCHHKGVSLRSCDNPIHGVRATGACFENKQAENCAYSCNYGNWEQEVSNLVPIYN